MAKEVQASTCDREVSYANRLEAMNLSIVLPRKISSKKRDKMKVD